MTRLQQTRKDNEHGLVTLLTVPIKHANKVLVLLRHYDETRQENLFHVHKYTSPFRNDWACDVEIENASLADCLKLINRDTDLVDDYCEVAVL